MRRIVSRITAAGTYEAIEADGTDAVRLDEMLRSRRPPGSVSDVEFFRGHVNKDANYLRAMTQRRYGFTPGPNDVYVPQLCRHGKPYDPLAWVPPTGGRGHIKKVLEQTGRGCEGLVKVNKPADISPPAAIPLAESLVNEEIARVVKKNPDKARRPKAELREEVIAKHGKQK